MLTISSGLLLIMMHLDGSLSLLILVVLHCFNTHYFLFAICQVLETTMEGAVHAAQPALAVPAAQPDPVVPLILVMRK